MEGTDSDAERDGAVIAPPALDAPRPQPPTSSPEQRLAFQARLLEAVEQAVIAIDLTGAIVYWSPYAERLYGWSAEEVLGLDILDVTPSEASGEQGRRIMERLKDGDSWSGEFRVRRKDGSEFLAHVTDSPIHDERGALVGVVGISSDVTARTQAEEERRQIMTRARCILWVAEITDTGSELAWDLRVSDLDAAQLVLPLDLVPDEPYLDAWRRSRHPDDKGPTDRRGDAAIRGSQPSYNQEFRCYDRHGRIHWLFEDVSIVPAGPGRWRAVGVCTDVTEQKRMREDLNTVVAGAECILWHGEIHEDESGRLMWETRFFDEEGVRTKLPVAIAEGQTYADAWYASRFPDDRERADREAEQAIREGRPVFRHEFRHRLADGGTAWMFETVSVESTGPRQWRVVGVCIDITDRKRTEQEFQSVLEHARCILWTTEVERRESDDGPYSRWLPIRFDERAAQGVLPLEILPGENYATAWWRSRSPEDDARMTQTSADAVLGGKSSYSQEFRCTDRHGHERWLYEDVSIRPIGDRQWQVIGMVTDITDRKRLEARLRKQAEQQTRAAEFSQHALTEVNLDRLLDAAAARIAGGVGVEFSAILELLPNSDRLVLRSGVGFDPSLLGELIFYTTPDALAGYTLLSEDPVIVEEFATETRFRQHNLLANLGVRSSISLAIRHEDGSPWGVVAAHSRTPHAFTHEDLVFFQGVAGALTAAIRRNRLQSALQKVTSSARCFVWHGEMYRNDQGTPSWHVQFFDEDGVRRSFPLRVEPGRDYVGAWSWSRLEEDRERSDREAEAAIFAGDPYYSQEFRHRLADGRIVWFLQTVSVESIAPRYWRLVGVCVDITDRKSLEAALRDRAEALSEADRRKDEFLAMLAHELRNPLGAITNGIQLLAAAGPSGDETTRVRGTIARQVDHLVRLVNDLLDVSRITRNQVELRFETIDFRAVVSDAVETVLPLLEARRHELTISPLPEPLWVHGDGARLQQVVGNLLGNAAKYTPAGGRIELAAGTEPGELSPWIVLRVRDNGQGISAELLPHVFDLFTQEDRSLARSEGGVGIGLTIAKRLVEMHGGRMEAYSEGPGRGAEFVVRLRATATASPPEASEKPAPRPEPRAGRRILVVEDNEDGARMLVDLLSLKGHDVRLASDGASALRAAVESDPEVVLLDIGLPDMDGYDVARELRKQPGLGAVFIIATTGYGQDDDRQRAREAGFDAHLVKPIDLDVLDRLLAGLPASSSRRTGSPEEPSG